MSDKQFEKFNLQDQSEVSTSDSTTPTPQPQQDWKEKFYVWYSENIHIAERPIDYLSANEVIDWYSSNVIQPLQSQNEALQKQVEHLKALGHEFVDNNEALQKEVGELHENLLIEKMMVTRWENDYEKLQKLNAELKNEVKYSHDDITFLHKERDELKAENPK